MAELLTINQLGASVGDTFDSKPIIRIINDGNYVYGVASDTAIAIDDQSASGFVDIGTMRIQWSDEPSATQGTVVFAQPFGNVPVVTATATQNLGHNIAVLSKSNTDFSFDQWDVNNTQQDGTWNWIAIGLKP